MVKCLKEMESLHQNLIEYNMEQIFQTVIILFETSIRNEEWRSINLMCLKFWVLPTFSSINIGVYNLLKCMQ